MRLGVVVKTEVYCYNIFKEAIVYKSGELKYGKTAHVRAEKTKG